MRGDPIGIRVDIHRCQSRCRGRDRVVGRGDPHRFPGHLCYRIAAEDLARGESPGASHQGAHINAEGIRALHLGDGLFPGTDGFELCPDQAAIGVIGAGIHGHINGV